jgi:hypothetical protein
LCASRLNRDVEWSYQDAEKGSVHESVTELMFDVNVPTAWHFGHPYDESRTIVVPAAVEWQ